MPTKREAMTARVISRVGCGYVYGATGWICTQARLNQQARQYPSFAQAIAQYGPRWIGKPCYDCAQLTRDAAQYAGVSLPSGATSQWRAAGIWQEKDVIDTLPDEAGLFLFTQREGRMTHTGLSIGGGESVDARGHAYGVVRRRISETSFTHWARLAIDYEAQADAPNPDSGKETRRTLRRGMQGEDVRLVQNTLLMLGYALPESGADGSFGRGTHMAVERFQRDHALMADGVVGRATWQMLDGVQPAAPDEEPAQMIRLCLSGAPLFALTTALRGARMGEPVHLTLSLDDYETLMAQIEAEV